MNKKEAKELIHSLKNEIDDTIKLMNRFNLINERTYKVLQFYKRIINKE